MAVELERGQTMPTVRERPRGVARAPGTDVWSLSRALALGPAVWDGLLRGAAVSSPFAGWAWHRAWADAAPPAEVAASRALVLRAADGDVQALLPFRLYRTRFRRVPVTALGWAIGDLGCPDHLDVPALPEVDYRLMLQALEPLPWDVMVLDNLAEHSPNADRLSAGASERGWTARRSSLWVCPYLELPRSWDAYLATLSPTRRQTIRRKERNLGRQHTVTLTDYGPDRWAEGWRHLVRLHRQRWDGPGALGSERVERLHAALATSAEPGALWLVTLELDGTPAAAWYGFAMGDTVSFYQGGWDPRWERESVGAVLMGMMIRRAIERGYRTFDFLRGEEPYKTTWTGAARGTSELAITRRGWKAAALRALDGVAHWRAALRAHPEGSTRG